MKNSLKCLVFLGVLTILLVSLLACSGNDPAIIKQVDWQAAIEILYAGRVTEIMQTHDLQVRLTLKDGSQITTVEPKMDAIFREVDRCGSVCDEVVLITE